MGHLPSRTTAIADLRTIRSCAVGQRPGLPRFHLHDRRFGWTDPSHRSQWQDRRLRSSAYAARIGGLNKTGTLPLDRACAVSTPSMRNATEGSRATWFSAGGLNETDCPIGHRFRGASPFNAHPWSPPNRPAGFPAMPLTIPCSPNKFPCYLA